ncbi:GNAT family N-acetyltransferase [Streptomyces sp. NPDC093808]|uniref:GNAT family N-acetyltransferase n=1 Tax=unclassified Streptomyces TaxID=2593676 RepID=UPI00344F8AA2
MSEERSAAMPAVSEEPWDGADGVRLRAAMEAELAARYGIPDQETDKPTARDTDVFLVARDAEGNATGCGALRRLSEDTAETKRMYVVPELRGTGAATGVLRTLEDHASRLGCKALHLSTGVLQPDAVRFYEREGYARTEGYGPYVGHPLAVCFVRRLVCDRR